MTDWNKKLDEASEKIDTWIDLRIEKYQKISDMLFDIVEERDEIMHKLRCGVVNPFELLPHVITIRMIITQMQIVNSQPIMKPNRVYELGGILHSKQPL